MRVWVEVTTLEGRDGSTEELVVEAPDLRAGLESVRRSLGASGPVSTELLGAGLRAFELGGDRRYVAFAEPPGVALAALLKKPERGTVRRRYDLVVARDHDPTPELPLTYRERGVRIASRKMSTEELVALLRGLLDEQRESLQSFPPGQVVELAAFAEDADFKSPLATLSYKDWRKEAKIAFPGDRGPTSLKLSVPPEHPRFAG